MQTRFAASDQGLHCSHEGLSSLNRIKLKIHTRNPFILKMDWSNWQRWCNPLSINRSKSSLSGVLQCLYCEHYIKFLEFSHSVKLWWQCVVLALIDSLWKIKKQNVLLQIVLLLEQENMTCKIPYFNKVRKASYCALLICKKNLF